MAQVRPTTQRTISYSDKQDKISLTTTGTSGPATFSNNTLNIPNYVPSGAGSGSVYRVTAGNGMVPATIDTAGRIDMANVIAAGSAGDSLRLLRVTYDSLGRITDVATYSLTPTIKGIAHDTAASVRLAAFLKVDSNSNGGAATYIYSQGHYVQLASHYNNPSWLDSLAYAKITGVPAFIRLVDLSATSPLHYNSSTGAFTLDTNNATTGGYLTPYRFGLYNSKQDALSGSGFARFSGSAVSYLATIPFNLLNISGTASSSKFLRGDSTWAAPTTTSQMQFSADGQGGVVTVGSSRMLTMTMAGTMTDWYLYSDPVITGSVAIQIKKNGVAITGGTQPNLSSAASNTGTTTSWSATTFSAGDVFTFTITSATAITGFNLTIKFTK